MTTEPDDDFQLLDTLFEQAAGATNGDTPTTTATPPAPVVSAVPGVPAVSTTTAPPVAAPSTALGDAGFFVAAPPTATPPAAETASPADTAPPPMPPPMPPPGGGDDGGTGGSPPGRPGRAVPPPTPRVERPPSSNRLEWVSLVFGVLALSLGLAMPYFTFVIFINAAAAIIPGVMVIRRSVNTGAPGRVPAAIGLLFGIIGAALSIYALADAGRQVRNTMGQFGSLLGDMELSMAANDARSLELAGIGHATIELDGTVVQLADVRCGFTDPAPGVRLAVHGFTYTPRDMSVVAISDKLSGQPDVMEIEIGSTGYLIAGEGLFAPVDGVLTVAGDFKQAGSDRVVPGRAEITCNR